MQTQPKRILILCKTYPSPSSKYSETSCVAGMCEDGRLIRIYPVPFRLLKDEQQFKKWQWITAKFEKSRDDHRPESHRIYVDTVSLESEPMPPGKQGWPKRMEAIKKLPTFSSFNEMERTRQVNGLTLAILKPSRIAKLIIKSTKHTDWTQDELRKLTSWQKQGQLFSEDEAAIDVALLEKLPYDFYYQCEFNAPEGIDVRDIKIVDWEIGALYRRLRKEFGPSGWEAPFRKKYEQELPSKNIMLMMGTIHRFPDQWLGISIFAPPKPQSEAADQGLLF